MSTARPFAYNTGSTISGTEQIGNLAIGYPDNGFDSTGINWRNGPDEDLGYVIARQIPSGNQPAPDGLDAYVAFWRTGVKTDEAFVNLVNKKFNQTFITGLQAENYLETNGYWTSWPGQIPQGMVLFLDAGNSQSYSGTGEVWYDLSGYGNHGSLSGATYASDNGGTMVFDGVNDAITFNNPVEIPIGNEDYTISVWFNSDEMPSIRGFIGWGAFGNINQVNAWRLQTFGGGATGFVHYWWGNDLSFQTPLSANTWYNAVVAYSNGSRKIYLNNVQVAEDFPTGHNVPYSTNLRVGVTYDGFNEWFDGKIAQVIIYKRQATPSEIESIWNSGKYRFGYGTTPTPTPTPSITPTNTITPTVTPTITPTNTLTPTTTPTPTPSSTPSSGGIVTSSLFMELDASNYTSGTWSDETGNGNNATINGATWLSTDGGIFDLDGTNDTISIPHNSNLSLSTSVQKTIQVWVKFDNLPGSSQQIPVFGKLSSSFNFDGYWGGLYSNGGVVRCTTNGTGTQKISDSVLTVTTNTWYLFTFISQITSTSNTTKVYINTTEYISTAHGSDGYSESNPLYLGFIGTGVGSLYLDGKIGACYFYTKGLNSTEISQNFDATKSKYGL